MTLGNHNARGETFSNARVQLMAFLAPRPRSFMEIRRGLEWGNGMTYRHTLVLEEAGMLQQKTEKRADDGRPTRTIFRITDTGWVALTAHAEQIGAVQAALFVALSSSSTL